jgi:erythromycin esterase
MRRAGLPPEEWWPSFAEDLDRLFEVRPVAVDGFEGLFRLATDPIRDREQFEEHLSQVRKALASVSQAELAAEAAFWNQVLFNVGAWAAKLRSVLEAGRWDRSDPAIREAALAANFSWLAERRYPQRKLIVWAATRHLMRNGAAVQPERGPAPDHLMAELRRRSMGDEVWKKFGTDTYLIAFSGYEWKGERAEDQGPQSIEAMLARAGFEVAFLDLRSPGPGSGWLKGTLRTRVLGHRERTAPWSQIIDGLFFVRTMTSVQLPASGAKADG